MAILSAIKSGIGKFNPFAKQGPTVQRQNSEKIVEGDVVLSYSEMGPEEIQRRNYVTLAGVNHDVPAHDRVLDIIKEVWRIVGPLAFVVFTAGEVFYYLAHFLPNSEKQNTWNQVLLWGVTLLIEIPFMIATYDLSSRKKRAAEARERGREAKERDTFGAIVAWICMAVVNVTGQVAFLALVTNVQHTGDGANWIYFFIIVRVLGVLLGDAYTAFFLLPPETTISRVVRTMRAQQEGLKLLGEAAMDRKREESRLMLDMQRDQNTINREKSEADFMNQFAQMNMENALEQQRAFFRSQRKRGYEADMGGL